MTVFRHKTILQGSVAARLRGGEIVSNHLTPNFLQNPIVKEFRKSVKIRQSYHEKFDAPFFATQCMYDIWRRAPVERDERAAGSAGDARARHRAPRRRLEREPDGDEAIDGDEDDDPGGHVLEEQRQEHERAARRRVDVEQRQPGHVADPQLERAHVQHGRVGDRQQQQEQVDGLAAHARAQQHRHRRHVARRTCPPRQPQSQSSIPDFARCDAMRTRWSVFGNVQPPALGTDRRTENGRIAASLNPPCRRVGHKNSKLRCRMEEGEMHRYPVTVGCERTTLTSKIWCSNQCACQ